MLSYPGGRKPPPRRHDERRGGRASRKLREAFEGRRDRGGPRLTPAQIDRQRERRRALEAADSERTQPGKVNDVLTALGTIAIALLLAWMLIAVLA